MTNLELLERIGEVREVYILEAHEKNAENQLCLNRIWLIAAIAAMMLLLVGCVAYSQGWFLDIFAAQSEVPLSESQISYIQENEQIIAQRQTKNGWTVEVCSALRDADKAYVILRVIAPEGISLEPKTGEGSEYISMYYDDQPGNLLDAPDGVMALQSGVGLSTDHDDLPNTQNYRIIIRPDLEGSTEDPFGPQARWKLRIGQILRNYEDTEYKQHLLDTKYKGDYGVMFTPEESQRIHQEEILAEGPWEFTITFDAVNEDAGKEELLTEPIRVEADILRRYGDKLWESGWFREEITLTSVQLQPLGVRIAYADCVGSPVLWFPDENLFVEEDVYSLVVMADGTVIPLYQSTSGMDGSLSMESNVPVIWEEADYLQFPDGTRVSMDGTVTYPERQQPPAAAEAYGNLPSESGMYADYADFDGDGIVDLAVWYDGRFHTLCLLDAKGEAKVEIPLEDGMDIYETYNQRSGEILWEPNQIWHEETVDGVEYFRIYRAAEQGLVLHIGARMDPGAPDNRWFRTDGPEESWKPITEEEYRRIVEDYQRMSYHLRPIK